MANIRSFPNNQDEFQGAEDVMRWFHGRSSGVFGAEGNASVAPVLDTMDVTVSDGVGWITNDKADGVVWWVDNEAASGNKLQLSVDLADAVLPRIDRVVVSWQTTTYADLPEIIILKGTAASTPVPPALTNNSLVRQISLAAISIPAGVTAITADMITDERLDDSVCGLVTNSVSLDTSMMDAKFKASYAEFLTYLENQKAAWESFFDYVQEGVEFPVPTADDAGKALAVNATCDGYTIKDDCKVITATIGTDWVGDEAPYTQAVAIAGILASDTPHVTPVYIGTLENKLAQMEAWGMISDGETGDGTIVFTCFEDKPEVEVSVQIEVNR